MNTPLNPLPIEDFSGGITDYVLSGKPNQFAKLDNVLIDPNKKAYTVPGFDIYNSSMYQIPAGNARVSSLFASTLGQLFLVNAKNIYYPNTTFSTLLGPTSNSAFNNGVSGSQAFFADWSQQIFATNDAQSNPVKIFQDPSGNWNLRQAGLPFLASTPTVTGTAGSGSYAYAFSYFDSYTVGSHSTTFNNFGPNLYVQAASIAAPNVSSVSITGIPVLSNGSTSNYNTSGLKVYIYRTINGGNVYYQVGSVTNGTTTFTDNVSDATLQSTGLQLYTNNGVYENTPPPAAKYITSVNGITYYGNIPGYPNRLMQSNPNQADCVPVLNTIDFPDQVMGLSNYNGNPLVFTTTHVFLVNGNYTSTGQGSVTWTDITKTIGCVSAASIVQTRLGVFWAAQDGFYWTDGFSFQKISDSINNTYSKIVSTSTIASRICGTYDSVANNIYWGCQLVANGSDNDSFLTLALRWGVSTESTFLTRSNAGVFYPTAVCMFQGNLLHGNKNGYLLSHQSSYNYDAYINPATTPSNWDRKALIPTVSTVVSSLGLPNKRKWVPKVLLTMQNESNISVQIYSVNDDSSNEVALLPFRFRGNFVWGDPNPIWGNNNLYWAYFNAILQMFRFPAGNMRCSYKQLVVTSAFTNIYRSADIGNAVVSISSKTATLTGSIAWPSYLADYYISFSNDGYVKNYPINLQISSTQISFFDPQSTSPNGTEQWLIRGYPKFETFYFDGIVMYYLPISDQSYPTYRSEQSNLGTN